MEAPTEWELFHGYSFSPLSSELKSLLFGGIPGVLRNAGVGGGTAPGLPGRAQPRDGRGAASSPATRSERLQRREIRRSQRSRELRGGGLRGTAAGTRVLALLASMTAGSQPATSLRAQGPPRWQTAAGSMAGTGVAMERSWAGGLRRSGAGAPGSSTRRDVDASFPRSNAGHGRQRWAPSRLRREPIAFSWEKGMNARSPLDVGMVGTRGCGPPWGRSRNALDFFGGEAKGVFLVVPGWVAPKGDRLRPVPPSRQVLRPCEAISHRIAECLGLEGTSGVTQPNPLNKQGHPEQAAQHRVQPGLEYLQRRRLHSPSGQPGPGLCYPQREEVLPRVPLELPLLPFVPVAPCPVAGHHWKEPGPVLLTPTLQIFRGISKVPSDHSLIVLWSRKDKI